MRGNYVNTLALIILVVGLVALVQSQQVKAYVCCVPFVNWGNIPDYWICRARGDIKTCCLIVGHVEDECSFPEVDPDIHGVQGTYVR
jgi:hypothetical protein